MFITPQPSSKRAYRWRRICHPDRAQVVSVDMNWRKICESSRWLWNKQDNYFIQQKINGNKLLGKIDGWKIVKVWVCCLCCWGSICANYSSSRWRKMDMTKPLSILLMHFTLKNVIGPFIHLGLIYNHRSSLLRSSSFMYTNGYKSVASTSYDRYLSSQPIQYDL